MKTLAELYTQLESQVPSLPLAKQASDIIPGEGDPKADILLIGEAPGFHEHQQRRPFVGRSGKLLRKTLEEVGYPPKTVYITNIVKVRPPDNRDPKPEEIEAFKPYLDQEIELIDPEVIVTLGRFSMAKFLPDVKISQVHGRLHKVNWNGGTRFILPMYHPAAALRSTKMRESFTSDFAKLSAIIDWIKQHDTNQAFTNQVAEALG